MGALPPSLAELFPDGDFRFHLTLRRGELRDFFQRHDSAGTVLLERRRWIEAAPDRYLGLLPSARPLVIEFEQMVGLADEKRGEGEEVMGAGWSKGHRVIATLRQLGQSLEPDFALLAPDDSGAFVLGAGAVCFPTGWALEEKLGRTLDAIHGVVPGLNSTLGSPIQQFLTRLKPGPAFLRSNWGIAASGELNLHPARGLASPQLPVELARLWLRVEHQVLAAMPRCGGVIFGIRVERYCLEDVASDAALAAGLHRALATMPADVAAYKGLAEIRPALRSALKKK